MKTKSSHQEPERSAESVRTKPSRAGFEHADSFPIVGVGASAGGFEAFTALLKGLPEEFRIAFILVQHLDPTHGSALPEILSRFTRLPVTQVIDGMRVEPRHIYVIPENTTMVIRDGALRLGARALTHGQHMPIDEFFRSLADECGNRAIGVILSGTASDGTEGCRAIKAAGGITFAQEESTAKFTGMPHSAIASGSVDFALEPGEIAKELVRISNHPYLVRATSSPDTPTKLVEPTELEALLKLLQQSSGVDFGQYKRTTMQRRIGRRMVVHHLENIRDYYGYVQEHPEELTELYRDILIHVTEFFRDRQAFDALREHVLPKILHNRKLDKNPIRIWVPGCSTGEEVYSIAIIALEYLWDTRAVPHGSITTSSIQIFATDISESALDQARSGLYSHAAVAQVSEDRLRRFF
jgi:two-component system, chemotaxis family, CheB/CheR fusion protein